VPTVTTDLRPLSLDDVDVAHRITGAAERADDVPYVTTLEEIRERFTAPDFDPSTDGRLALLDGEPAGVAYIEHSPSGERLEVASLNGCVDPTSRRRGVGTALLSWQLARGRELMARYEHGLPCHLRTYNFVHQTDSIALAEELGLAPIRWFDQLVRPMGKQVEAPVPEGITIDAWDRGLQEEVRAVRNAAFADHWGSTARTAESFAHWMEGSTTRLDLSFVARRDGRVVGYSINEHYPEDADVTGRLDGWIAQLGVLKDERGRGIASALIAASVEAFRAVGFDHAMLDVDSANPSNAHELYRRLGFELVQTEVAHELTVAPGAAPESGEGGA
jgi:mycothiol synthase